MSNVGKQKRGLGRGLSALMADIEPNSKEGLKTKTSTKLKYRAHTWLKHCEIPDLPIRSRKMPLRGMGG